MDWQQLIDEAVDGRLDETAFPEPDVPARVAAGRASLRRRRTAIAGLACTAVVVVGGVAWAAPEGGTRGADPVHTPTSAPTTAPTTAPTSSSATPERELPPVHYGDDDEVVVRDGWRIARRIEDPISAPLTDGRQVVRSLAVDARRGAEHQWLLLLDVPGGSEVISANAAEGASDFYNWVDLTVAGESQVWSTAIVGRNTSGLAPGAGVTILRQQRAPELGPLVRVAEVEILSYHRWIVARPGPTGGLEARVVPFRRGADPAAFIAHVRDEHLLEAGR